MRCILTADSMYGIYRSRQASPDLPFLRILYLSLTMTNCAGNMTGREQHKLYFFHTWGVAFFTQPCWMGSDSQWFLCMAKPSAFMQL